MTQLLKRQPPPSNLERYYFSVSIKTLLGLSLYLRVHCDEYFFVHFEQRTTFNAYELPSIVNALEDHSYTIHKEI